MELVLLISAVKKPKKSCLKAREAEEICSLLKETLHKRQFSYSHFREKETKWLTGKKPTMPKAVLNMMSTVLRSHTEDQ